MLQSLCGAEECDAETAAKFIFWASVASHVLRELVKRYSKIRRGAASAGGIRYEVQE